MSLNRLWRPGWPWPLSNSCGHDNLLINLLINLTELIISHSITFSYGPCGVSFPIGLSVEWIISLYILKLNKSQYLIWLLYRRIHSLSFDSLADGGSIFFFICSRHCKNHSLFGYWENYLRNWFRRWIIVCHFNMKVNYSFSFGDEGELYFLIWLWR